MRKQVDLFIQKSSKKTLRLKLEIVSFPSTPSWISKALLQLVILLPFQVYKILFGPKVNDKNMSISVKRFFALVFIFEFSLSQAFQYQIGMVLVGFFEIDEITFLSN